MQKLSSPSPSTGSKWPISPDSLMLKVCAAQVVHARGWPLAVGAAAGLYIGGKAYGAPLQVRCTGSKMMWRNPVGARGPLHPLAPVAGVVDAGDPPARGA